VTSCAKVFLVLLTRGSVHWMYFYSALMCYKCS
jgi:hypothetical protein